MTVPIAADFHAQYLQLSTFGYGMAAQLCPEVRLVQKMSCKFEL